MTIHNILMNCGSVTANTVIIIRDGMGDIKSQHRFRYLPSKLESLDFVTFTIGFDFQYRQDIPNLQFTFYV